jgi:hypothetical protein
VNRWPTRDLCWPTCLDLDLLRNFERVLDLRTQVPYGGLQFMPQEQLEGSDILRTNPWGLLRDGQGARNCLLPESLPSDATSSTSAPSCRTSMPRSLTCRKGTNTDKRKRQAAPPRKAVRKKARPAPRLGRAHGPHSTGSAAKRRSSERDAKSPPAPSAAQVAKPTWRGPPKRLVSSP